ncbi:MAG TPA: hypothetical protein VHW00_08895 [Thermoanaerobaculia bacterium]|nr:hypothetical protein [Thermoanaerobaculia bacterium]
MNCTEFQQSLDDGSSVHDEHVQACPSCAHALRASLELERLLRLAAPPLAEHDALNDAVLQRIRRRHLIATLLGEPLVTVALAMFVVIAWNVSAITAMVIALAQNTFFAAFLLIACAALLTPLWFLNPANNDR